MKKLWLRLCSLVLVTVLTIQSLPASAFAIQTDSIPPASTEDFIELDEMEDLSKVETEEAKILEENIEGRTEFSKQFLLDNGLNLAVLYDSAVHFEKNGQWEEIDNTLLAKSNGTYANKAGIWEVEFPQQLTQNNQIFITKGGYTLSFGMAGELRQQGNLEVMSTGNEKQQEELEASSNAVAPEEMITDTVVDGTNNDSAIFEIISHEGTQHQSSSDSNNTSQEATVLELDTQLPTATVLVDGAAQTFAVASAQTANGQIQKIDREELFAAVEHPETVLEKPFSQLMYENVYSNTDVRYDLVGNQVKESVILEAYSSTLRGYQFSLNTGALVPVLAEDGHIDFYDTQQKNIIMVMPAPYLVDEDNAFCNDVRVSLSGKDGVYTLTYLLPHQWLAASDRAWPVVLDPVVSADINVLNMRDKTIGSKYTPGFEYEANEMGVGSKHGIQHCYLKYDNLPALTSSDVILEARISMRYLNSYNGSGTVEVHKVNGVWDSTTLTWSNEPAFDDNVEDYITLGNRTWYSWDVTDIARGWYCGENTGMMFKVPDTAEAQTSTNSWIMFYSSDNYAENRPVLEIYFRNNNGLESYWDYTTASAGRAGTAYVNQYTGNLTWVHSDLGFGGNRMPVSINHVYNANDAAVTHFGIGKGWRTNFNQLVYPWSVNASYYVWEDADGTDHYFFYESSGTYKDED